MPFKMLLNMPLGLVSITFGIKGPNFILYPGADQGAFAMAHALRGLRAGRFARVLVGCSACSLGLSPIMQLRRAGLASSLEEAQPFSPRHAGWAPADQAAFLLLETEAEAARRERSALAYLEEAALLGPDSVEHLWQSMATARAPDALLSTGMARASEVSAERESARRWVKPPVLACADGLLGVAPAASFVLASALACLALSSGSLPAGMSDGAVGPLARAWVCFHDAQSAALAVLSATGVTP